MNEVKMIPIGDVRPHPKNPRKDLGDLTDLIMSIKAMGVLNPLLVIKMMDGTYMIIAGHRRAAAAKEAGLKELPCIITKMTALEQQYAMWTENEQRANLTPREQAGGIQMMLDLGATVDDVAEKTGLSKKTVKARAEIARLDQKILEKREKTPDSYQLSIQDYEELSRIRDVKERNKLLEGSIYSRNDLIQKVDAMIRKQTEKKNMEILEKELKKKGFLQTKDGSVTYSSAWEILQRIDLTGKGLRITVEPDKDRQIFWYVGWSVLYIAAPAIKEPEDEEEDRKEKELQEKKSYLESLRKEYMAEMAAYIKNIMDGKITIQTPRDKATEVLWKNFIHISRPYENLCRFIDNWLCLGEKLTASEREGIANEMIDDEPIETQMCICIFMELEWKKTVQWGGSYDKTYGNEYIAQNRIMQDIYGYWPTNEKYFDLINGTHEKYERPDEEEE